MICSEKTNAQKQIRRVMITINHPLEKGLTRDVIKSKIMELKSTVYYAISDEIGVEGTPHCHLAIFFRSPVRWQTIQKKFEGGHIDVLKGTAQEVRDYIAKEGKFALSEKKKTSVSGSFEEWGEIPNDVGRGKRTDIDFLFSQIKNGASDYEILEANPRYLRYINLIEKGRLAVDRETATTTYQSVTITYIYGDHGVGKTPFVLNNFDSVFRTTAKKNIFDNYSGQAVLFLDSYFNNIPLDELLLCTENFRTELTCRYCNKYSNWRQVIIASTKPITEQYKDDQYNNPDEWKTFLHRVTTIMHFLPNGEKVHYKVDNNYNIVPVGLDDTTPDFPGGSPSV